MPKFLSLKDAKLIKQHRYILKKLSSSSSADRKKILKNAPDALFKALNIIIKLLAQDKLNISKKNQKKVNRHKKLIRKVSTLKSNSIKRKLQNQRGGFLSAILSAALPVISNLLGNIF